jgi:hypothetical protein
LCKLNTNPCLGMNCLWLCCDGVCCGMGEQCVDKTCSNTNS